MQEKLEKIFSYFDKKKSLDMQRHNVYKDVLVVWANMYMSYVGLCLFMAEKSFEF